MKTECFHGDFNLPTGGRRRTAEVRSPACSSATAVLLESVVGVTKTPMLGQAYISTDAN
ncbi:hypothetical protein SESBI_04380 [Sesbania bispinosa]|nr:hypothetical protein SESBI_04380 [Sesbania bispinosa]